jgi:hypothetical protein
MVVSKISDESVQLFGSGQGVREDVTAQGARGKTIKSIHRAKKKEEEKKDITCAEPHHARHHAEKYKPGRVPNPP